VTGISPRCGVWLTDAFIISSSYDHNIVILEELKRGLFGLVTKNDNGQRINAVVKNFWRDE